MLSNSFGQTKQCFHFIILIIMNLRTHNTRKASESKTFSMPKQGTLAYQLIQLADNYYEAQPRIPLTTLYFMYSLCNANQTYNKNDIMSRNWIYPIATVFGLLVDDILNSGKDQSLYPSLANQLFRKIVKQTQSTVNLGDDVIYETVKSNPPTITTRLATKQPTGQWKQIGVNISPQIIFALDPKFWKTGVKLLCTIMTISDVVYSSFTNQRVASKIGDIPTVPLLKYKQDNKFQYIKDVGQMIKKQQKQRQQIDSKAAEALKNIEEKKGIQFGDFSKFAYYKQIKQSTKKNEVQMIVKQAIQSHRQAVQQITKLDAQTEQMLKKSWTDFMHQIVIIKTYKQFSEFQANPVDYFIKHRLTKNKLKVYQVSQQFAKVMIRYFNFINIQGRVLHKKNLYLERSLKNLNQKYIPLNDSGNILLKSSDKSIHYLVNQKIIKKNAGYYLTEPQIAYMENSIIQFLKVKNLDKSRQEIKYMLVQELNKMLKST